MLAHLFLSHRHLPALVRGAYASVECLSLWEDAAISLVGPNEQGFARLSSFSLQNI